MIDWRSIALRLTTALWLAATWTLLWGDGFHLGTMAASLLVAATLMLAFPLPQRRVLGEFHVLAALRLVGYVIVQVVVSSFHVAWLSVRPGPQPNSALLVAPLRLQTDFVLALAVNTLNIIPGGIVVRIDERNRQVVMHVLAAGTPREIEKFYADIEAIEWLYVCAFEPRANRAALLEQRRSTPRDVTMRDLWLVDDVAADDPKEVH